MSGKATAPQRPKKVSPERLPGNLRLNLSIGAEPLPGLAGPCWVWIGRLNRNGYGRIRHRGREPVAHRAVYEELIGPIGAGMVLDHLCRTRCCCNPHHLEPVTVQANTHRGDAVLFAPRQSSGVL